MHSSPQKFQNLKAFLGLLSNYTKFLHNLVTTLAPLYKLLQKNQKWWWDAEQENAHTEAKHLLTISKILTHFDSDKPLVLACDASPVGD